MKTAIVTGAASGIGRATAERLTDGGWRVVGVDTQAGVEVVGDAAEAATLARALELAGGSLSGLVCSAGVPPGEDWSEILRVDLTGPYVALQAVLPALARAKGSAVVVGSIIGSAEGSTRSPGYAAAKAGLGGLVKSMALIGAPLGVRVNLVEPGAIDTPFDPPRYPPNDRPDVPLGRMGTAAEVAAAIAFLLSDDASYITGSSLRVDGGRTIAGRH